MPNNSRNSFAASEGLSKLNGPDLNKNAVSSASIETADVPVAKSFVIAKLTKAHSFRRGDFKLIDYGIELKMVKIAADKGDRANLPEEGSMFYITGLPVDAKGNVLPDNYDGKYGYLNRHTRKYTATSLTSKNDEVNEMDSIPPTDLHMALRQIASALTDPFKKSKDGKLPFQCNLAPITLKDAIKRAKGLSSSKHRIIAKGARTKDIDEKDPDGNPKKVVVGSYIEQNEDGVISMVSNGKGIVMDEEGDVSMQGDFKSNTFGQQRITMGFDSKPNMLSDMQPKTVVLPMGLGPLALDRLPDFSLINWAFKLFNVFKVVKETISETKVELKLNAKLQKLTDSEQSQSEVQGTGKAADKAFNKFISKLPFNI
jgi:hypothetical protein